MQIGDTIKIGGKPYTVIKKEGRTLIVKFLRGRKLYKVKQLSGGKFSEPEEVPEMDYFKFEPPGVPTGMVVFEAEKLDNESIQALLFDKEKWDEASAKKWAVDHDYKPIKVTTSEDGKYVHVRLIEPEKGADYRVIVFSDKQGIRAIYKIAAGKQQQAAGIEVYSNLIEAGMDVEVLVKTLIEGA